MRNNFIFFDLDGTLIEKGSNEISKENLEAIKKLKRKGKIIINTGRDIKRTLEVKELCNEVDYIISSLGTLLTDNKGNVIKKYSIPKDVCYKVVNNLYNDTVIGYATLDGEKIISKNDLSIYYDNCAFEHRKTGKIVSKDEFLKDAENDSVLAFYFYSKDKMFTFKVKELIYFKSYGDGYDSVLKDMNKGYIIANYFRKQIKDYKNAHFYAFGDGINDLPMFNACNTSISFIDSSIEAKQKASIVSSVKSTDNGVAFVLNNLLMID
jgi:hypothetical protein